MRGTRMAEPLKITVYRINESLHKSPEESIDAATVSIDEDGSLKIKANNGRGWGFSAGTWGSIEIDRVPGRRDA